MILQDRAWLDIALFGRLSWSRWHGKSKTVATLRQLQRTAGLVFPEEVTKNGTPDRREPT